MKTESAQERPFAEPSPEELGAAVKFVDEQFKGLGEKDLGFNIDGLAIAITAAGMTRPKDLPDVWTYEVEMHDGTNVQLTFSCVNGEITTQFSMVEDQIPDGQ